MMTVIIADSPPDFVRGMLKRWFIEPHPNVFVGTLNKRAYSKTIEFIKRNSGSVDMLIISSDPNSQGFVISSLNNPNRKNICLDGLWLISEKLNPENRSLIIE